MQNSTTPADSIDFKGKNYLIHLGDCINVMKTLPDNSIQCCVTSPPYWNLRDYQCEWQIGLEPTMQEYIDKVVQVFAEVYRILRKDGTVWLNLGDGYCNNSKPGGGDPTIRQRNIGTSKYQSTSSCSTGLKPKDLFMIPARVAIALQEWGWYLRDDIIWSKPNSMPGSQKDRCTFAYEHIFMLSKSRHYYFDWETIAEPVKDSTVSRLNQDLEGQVGSTRGNGGAKTNGNMKAVVSRKQDNTGNPTYTGFNERYKNRKHFDPSQAGGGSGFKGHTGNKYRLADGTIVNPVIAMKRNVWTIATQPTKESHFATFPEKLVEPCIFAGCPPDGIVLDPFLGSGTTMLVALRLGRKCIGIELNENYLPIIHKKITPFTATLFDGEE